jgi:hypothetical protein
MKKDTTQNKPGKNNWLIISITAIAIIGLVLFFIFKPKNKKDNTIVVKIISPYNCFYQIKIHGDSVNIKSQSRKVSTVDSLNVKTDTFIRQYDTLSNASLNATIENHISTIVSKEKEIDATFGKDAYGFELYYNDTLIKKKDGNDEDFDNIIKVLRPLVIKERIQCCEFFIMFDTINRDCSMNCVNLIFKFIELHSITKSNKKF